MLKSVASTFIIRLVIAFSNLAIAVVLSRNIGAEGKGEASLIILSVAMILLFCNIVGGASLPYFVPRHNTALLLLLSNGWTILVCSIAFCFIFFFEFLNSSFVVDVILLSVLSSFLATNLSVLLGKDRVKEFNYISLLQVLINFFFLLVFFFTDKKSVQSYVFSYYIAIVVCLIISSIAIFKYLKNSSFLNASFVFVEMFKLGFNNQLGHVMKFVSGRLGFYLLAFYSGNQSLGVFSNGIALVESVLIISNSYATVLYPKVLNSKDNQISQYLTVSMIKQSVLLCFFALLILLALPSLFWVWLLGSEFGGVKIVILLVSPGIFFYNVVLLLSHYFSGVGKVSVNTFANFIGLFVASASSILIVPQYDIIAGSLIISISNVSIGLILIYIFLKDSRLRMVNFLPNHKDFDILLNGFKSIFRQ
ncbi:MAG: hypothetical protein JNL69_02900 [Bacteroidia bacterium]|nr:hypothetical protein [Bacteroidia bacterium]